MVRLTDTTDQTTLAATPTYAKATTDRVQLGRSRITIITLQTQQGLARITDTAVQLQLGRSRITATTTRHQLGEARITATATQIIEGKANITSVGVQIITGVAHIITPSIITNPIFLDQEELTIYDNQQPDQTLNLNNSDDAGFIGQLEADEVVIGSDTGVLHL